MTDQRQGVLNPLGINCLRDFANIGTAVFGSRTLVTLTDQQWRYVPVRRTALFLEQSLLASLKWVVFEPNSGVPGAVRQPDDDAGGHRKRHRQYRRRLRAAAASRVRHHFDRPDRRPVAVRLSRAGCREAALSCEDVS